MNVQTYEDTVDVYPGLVNKYDDLQIAEKARNAYLVLYPEINPQNVQVVQFAA